MPAPHLSARSPRTAKSASVTIVGKPIVFLVHHPARVMKTLAGDLRRWFTADYQVLGGQPAGPAMTRLTELGDGEKRWLCSLRRSLSPGHPCGFSRPRPRSAAVGEASALD
jgi:hypothetical protein